MIIVGIDPGLAITGYGILEKTGSKVAYKAHGVMRTGKELPLPVRMLSLANQLGELLDLWKPGVMVTEKLFFSSNVNTAMMVGGSIGVILLCAAQRNIEWFEYRPAEVKMAVAGYGAAEKKQVQYMISRLLNLSENPRPDDAADALAIALCHAHTHKF